MSETINFSSTIAAIATPPGRGGIGIIRISGALVSHIAEQLLGKIPSPRFATYATFRQEKEHVIDRGLAFYFPAPNSFTGEDVLELHGHGGPVVMDMLMREVIRLGAQMALPGEFSERAFVNGKIDLAQAEAIADLINASTEQAALGAMRSLQGVFSQKITEMSEKMQLLRMMVEAAIDFPEEEIDFLTKEDIVGKIQKLSDDMDWLLKETKQGELLQEGMSLAIVGRPNAGKSSLLNVLSHKNSAIVTPHPGTTRDLIKETIQLEGMPVHIIDTAGIRLDAEEIEQEGINRAKAQLPLVDRILLMVDASLDTPFSRIEEDIIENYSQKVTIVMNKIDIKGARAGEREGKIYISASQHLGIEALRSHLLQCVGFQGSESGMFIARRRHLVALEKTCQHIKAAHLQLVKYRALELCAQELRQGQEALGEIVGKVTTDDLLGQIFSTFCIGK